MYYVSSKKFQNFSYFSLYPYLQAVQSKKLKDKIVAKKNFASGQTGHIWNA